MRDSACIDLGIAKPNLIISTDLLVIIWNYLSHYYLIHSVLIQVLDNKTVYHFFIDTYFLSTRSISPAPFSSVYTTMDAVMDAAITISLPTTSCPHKVNKSCTSINSHSHYCSECKGSIGTHTHTTAQNVKVILEPTLLHREHLNSE